ncbi:MAG TPA: NAD(P)H-dependent glycerol-3-phosphate dehydrogenase [Microthrixaceae bacterium]|nr:NAD(P)H-dependent glycerol-3-phosphate dehydrogenase [Microthrixaceae bacterium]
MRIRAAVIGGGSWGTTVAHIAAHQVETVLWARREDLAAEINEHHTNQRYLPGFELHPGLSCSSDLTAVVDQADVLIMGVPSQGFRSALEQVAPHVRAWVPVLSLTKGLEQTTQLRMTQIINQVMPGHPAAVLTGPNLAKEILSGDAAAAVIATADPVVADQLQRIFHMNLFRVYTNPDVIGCELAGALKNVIAIAAGMADGLGAGDNTKAMVITRGLAELSRLGEAMGGQFATFAGLAGMGDLMATCMSRQSRNRHVGEELGKGRTIEEIIADMNMVAEGVKTSRVVMALANQYEVEMPVASEVFAVCHEGATAEDAYRGLIRRQIGGLEHSSLHFH